MKHLVRRLSTALLISLGLLIAGCNKLDLYTQLSERHANEMIAVLMQGGIPATKHSETGQNGQSWTVKVPDSQFSNSMEILKIHGFPREDFKNLGQLFKKQGFVSTPTEERALLMYGLSQEIANSLSAIDGVVMARVHLTVPEKDPLSDKPKAASASVLVKHQAGIDLNAQVGQIKAFVVNSVEGLKYENVTVALFPATTTGSARPLPVKQNFAAGGLISPAISGEANPTHDIASMSHGSGNASIHPAFFAIGFGVILAIIGLLILRRAMGKKPSSSRELR